MYRSPAKRQRWCIDLKRKVPPQSPAFEHMIPLSVARFEEVLMVQPGWRKYITVGISSFETKLHAISGLLSLLQASI